jgi:type I restriction enzyme S subunit
MRVKRGDTCRLGDISDKIRKGTTPTTIGYPFVERGINFIKAESISMDGSIDASKFVFIDSRTHNKLKRSQIEEHDLLFSMAGMVLGKTAVVKRDYLPANTNQAVAVIRLNQKIAVPQYVAYFMRQKSFFNYVNQSTGQSAQPNINLEEIGNFEIVLPDLQTQTRCACPNLGEPRDAHPREEERPPRGAPTGLRTISSAP